MPFDRKQLEQRVTGLVNAALTKTRAWVAKYRTPLSIFVVILFVWMSYWAFIGFSLDNSIRRHIAECETKIVDPAKHRCVVSFIPIPK